MVRSALYAAIGLVAISSTAWAEDLSSATAPLPPGTFTTSAHSDEWKIANALSAGPAKTRPQKLHPLFSADCEGKKRLSHHSVMQTYDEAALSLSDVGGIK